MRAAESLLFWAVAHCVGAGAFPGFAPAAGPYTLRNAECGMRIGDRGLRASLGFFLHNRKSPFAINHSAFRIPHSAFSNLHGPPATAQWATEPPPPQSPPLKGRAGEGDPTWQGGDGGVQKLAEKYWDALMERRPTWATSLGDYRFNDRLEDVSEESREQWTLRLRALLAEANRISAAGLPPADRLTRELLIRAIRDALLELNCRRHHTPLNPLSGPHIEFPLLLVSQPFRDAADFRNYTVRLRAFPKQVTDHITNMRAGITRGLVHPRVIIEKVIPQIRNHIVQDATRSEFYKPAVRPVAPLVNRGLWALGETERKAVTAELVSAIKSDVIPAYLQLLAFVEDEYLPQCRQTVGIGSVPNGLKVYDALVYLNTTVRRSPDEIHELGLAEVARIRLEMGKVQQTVGFAGSLDAFIVHMRTDPRYRFATAAELVAAGNEILQRTKSNLSTLFSNLPRADCVMKEIESFRAAASPVAYYNPPPEDGSRPGYYYINTSAPQERLRFTLEALTYHEAVPGHHLQIALDQENTDLPKFRRYGGFTAYVEGWALYAEQLGYEIGGYKDPYQRFGQLTLEMWRACRLVVDTGLHTKGWSRKQAIDYLAGNTSLTLIDIEAEVDRYICWPGQALGYKIGELAISQLRRFGEQQLGRRFDLRAFHDALLAGGAMPIDMLEQRMRTWITARKNGG